MGFLPATNEPGRTKLQLTGEANINLDAYWPKPYLDYNHNDKNRHPSTRYLVNASYLRLQNLQLGYSLPSDLLAKLKLKHLRVYLAAENLLTLTYLHRGIDPVAIAGFGGGAGATYGADKIISMGLSVTL